MDLGPRFDKSALGYRQRPAQGFQSIDGEHSSMLWVIRVEMRPMMLAAGSTNMRITMPKNRASSDMGCIGLHRVDVVGLTTPNQPRADKCHAARRLHLDVRRHVHHPP
jgi:hypothetical protein